ncbi:MAG: UvrB/UvrC motif-containing protein [Limnochordales bacterium]|nr:UvrB/UvrC motif-containing protein [Limnochordales bacterium]
MVCDECHERPATVHVVTQINGHREERWLCEQCARSRRELQPFNFSLQSPAFAFQNLLSSLFDTERNERNGGSTYGQHRSRGAGRPDRCEVCGATLADFRRTGLLGCAHCYVQFAGPLEPVIRQVQGSIAHRGKRPVGQVAAGTGAGTGTDAGTADRPSRRPGATPECPTATSPRPETESGTTDSAGQAAGVPARLAQLRAEMRRAVAEERYEDAARLRDRIRELEAMLSQRGEQSGREGQGEGAGSAGR